MKRVLAVSGLVLVVALAWLSIVNFNSLDDGVGYLQDKFAYREAAPQPLDEQGRFGFCNQFATLRNAQRARFIENYLGARDIPFERLPIANTTFDNLYVKLGGDGPLTLYSAHYDKAYDDPDYQGASDNSAAVCMLLVAAAELNRDRPAKPFAILFTGEEEVGLVGAQAFYAYATQNNVQVEQVLNFDSMGRGGIAARASGERSGFLFTLPFLGEFVYDGRQLTVASPYRQPDAKLLDRLNRIVPITRMDRMVAKSDGTYFQEQGWNAINLSSDDLYYLDETWHTYRDRVELLDGNHFERALDLMLTFARAGNNE